MTQESDKYIPSKIFTLICIILFSFMFVVKIVQAPKVLLPIGMVAITMYIFSHFVSTTEYSNKTLAWIYVCVLTIIILVMTLILTFPSII
jgi:hypothetical protein